MTPQTSVFLPVAEMGQLAGFWIALVRITRKAFLHLLLLIVVKIKISRKQ